MKKIYPVEYGKSVHLLVDDDFLEFDNKKVRIADYSSFFINKSLGSYYLNGQQSQNILLNFSIMFPNSALAAYEQLVVELTNRIYSVNANYLDDPAYIAIVDLDYISGHPELIDNKKVRVGITKDDLQIIQTTTAVVSIKLRSIVSVRIEKKEEIERRITATRLFVLGAFALAFRKKKVHVDEWLTIDVKDANGLDYTLIFDSEDLHRASSSIFKAIQESKGTESPKATSILANNVKSIPEQIKEYKELLDLGIITMEEFEKKKKELLNM